MTPQEFKAWFDGFTEAFTGTPTKAQWVRVKERVAEIDGKPVTERVFVDRYYPSYPPYYWRQYSGAYWPAYNGIGSSGAVDLGQNAAVYNMARGDIGNQYAANLASGSGIQAFNSTAAMAELGRADAGALP